MTITRRGFLASTTALAATVATRQARAMQVETQSPYVLHFKQPATKWPDALPVGNGRLGAVVFGDPANERIQLNEESIWDGQPGLDRNNPKAGEAIPKIRELLFAGKIAEAEALAQTDLFSIPQRMPCYQTLGDLHLTFSKITGKVEDYRLELDLDTAIVRTTFTHEGTKYTREVFSSVPDQVIVVRLTSDPPGPLHVSMRWDRPGPTPSTVRVISTGLTLDGQALPVNDNPGLPNKEPQSGVRFHAQLLAVFGTLAPNVTDATKTVKYLSTDHTITLLIDCATSYRYPSASATPDRFVEGDADAMQAAVSRNLNAAARLTYAELKSRHIAEHQRLFRRVDLSLGPDPNAATPTDQRVQHIKDGGDDPHLLPIYFQYGRYMLISSSRPGTLAANLQGIWNESVDPPWGSKYTVNINTQMNYWLADRANLSELHAPLFDLLESTQKAGAITAQKYYKARGTVVHHNTDIWGDSGPIDGLGGGIWPMGSAWLSLHLWDHYDYTRDHSFLSTRAYPTLRANAQFLLDYLVVAPAGTPYAGLLVTGPSCSPENKYKLPSGKSYNLCMAPSMDNAITRAVLTRFLQAAKLTGASDALATQAKAALDKLPPYKITHDQRLQEWPEDYVDQEPGHRHISHLFGLFPDSQITPETTPALAAATHATLDARLAAGGGSTGWSRSWTINCYARLRDAEAAHQSVLQLFRQSTRPNLFDVCGLKENSPFQIDGNLGGPTGLIEMLLQSHRKTPNGEPILHLLPALPKAWPSGSFRGLCARGGITIDLVWKDGQPIQATLASRNDITFTIVSPKPSRHSDKPLTLKAGTAMKLTFA
jgi:alpha-L-fucosidase 2